MDKWVVCGARLPEDNEIVLFKCNYMMFDYITVGYFINGNRGHSYVADDDLFFRSAVLEWKPTNLSKDDPNLDKKADKLVSLTVKEIAKKIKEDSERKVRGE